jgi:predicted kinase
MKRTKVYLLVGAPGCGKSTWAKEMVEKDSLIVLLCPDTFRARFGTSEGDQSVSAKAFEATRYGLDAALADGKDVIVDATNMYKKARKQFLDIARKYLADTEAVVFEVDRDTLLERNKTRGEKGGRNVPVEVIDNMLAKYQKPDLDEFDTVTFIGYTPSWT